MAYSLPNVQLFPWEFGSIQLVHAPKDWSYFVVAESYCPSRHFTIDQRFSIALRSGLCAGRYINLKCCSPIHSFTILAVCFG